MCRVETLRQIPDRDVTIFSEGPINTAGHSAYVLLRFIVDEVASKAVRQREIMHFWNIRRYDFLPVSYPPIRVCKAHISYIWNTGVRSQCIGDIVFSMKKEYIVAPVFFAIWNIGTVYSMDKTCMMTGIVLAFHVVENRCSGQILSPASKALCRRRPITIVL